MTGRKDVTGPYRKAGVDANTKRLPAGRRVEKGKL
jgi:hypothetical protein